MIPSVETAPPSPRPVLVYASVCQETVWEAFQIFWDRLPKNDEYQDWLPLCQDGTASILEIGSRFSQSEEYQSLVRNVSGVIKYFSNCFFLFF